MLHNAQEMVRSGWLVVRDGRYEITPERVRAAKQRELAAKHVFVRRPFRFPST